MMNIFALSVVLTTLLIASVHSPHPQVKDVIVKEGHRVVMVEFDEEGETNTKVSISSSDEANGQFGASVKGKINDVVGDAKEKLKAVNNLGQGVKDSARDKANEASHLAKDAGNDVKSRMLKLFSAAWMTKDTVAEKAKQGSDVAGNSVKNTKSRMEGGAKVVSGMAKQGAKETAEMARQKAWRGKEAVEEAIATTKRLKVGVEKNTPKKTDKIRRHGRGLLHSMICSLRSKMRILQLFGFATGYGMSMWVTFMSNYVLARVLPRQQFASAQSKIYPFYLKAMACSIGLCFLGHSISEWKIRKFISMETFQGLNLLLTLAMILANLFYFEPRLTKVMFEKLKYEKETGRGQHDSQAAATTTTTTTKALEASTKETETTEAAPGTPTGSPAASGSATGAGPSKLVEMSETLKKLHSWSSFVNVVTLIGLNMHLVYLGQCLGITC